MVFEISKTIIYGFGISKTIIYGFENFIRVAWPVFKNHNLWF